MLQVKIKGGGIPLSLKKEIRIVFLLKELVVPSVVKSIKESICSVWVFSMDVEKVATN